MRIDTNFDYPFEDDAKTLFDSTITELRQKYNCSIHFKSDVLVRDISKTYNSRTAYEGFYDKIVASIDKLPFHNLDECTVTGDEDSIDNFKPLLDPWIHYNELGTENLYPVNIHVFEHYSIVHPGNTRMMLAENFDKFYDTTVDLVICDYTNQYEHNIQFENFPHGIRITDFNNSSHRGQPVQFFSPRETFNKNFYNKYHPYLTFKYNAGILECNSTPILTLDTEKQKVNYFDNQDTGQIIDRNWQQPKK